MILLNINSNEAGQRFDKYLKKLLKEAPDSFIYKMLRKKNITLNGKKADGKEKLSLNDEVKLFLADETYEKFAGKSSDKSGMNSTKIYENAYKQLGKLQVIYENEHILVVNKPSGVLSQKAEVTDVSLNEWFVGYLLENKKYDVESLDTFKPSICNRLDRNTSGMVVCGKSLAGSQYMSKVIKDKTLRKFYYCLVDGEVNIDKRVTGYLYKDKTSNKVRIYKDKNDIPQELAKEATYIDTAFKTVKVHNNITLLEVELFTGKTHQIRAHLSSLGHPIIGDGKYGNVAVNKKYYGMGVKDQLLHSHKLIFPKSEDEKFSDTDELILHCNVPDIFDKVLGEKI